MKPASSRPRSLTWPVSKPVDEANDDVGARSRCARIGPSWADTDRASDSVASRSRMPTSPWRSKSTSSTGTRQAEPSGNDEERSGGACFACGVTSPYRAQTAASPASGRRPAPATRPPRQHEACELPSSSEAAALLLEALERVLALSRHRASLPARPGRPRGPGRRTHARAATGAAASGLVARRRRETRVERVAVEDDQPPSPLMSTRNGRLPAETRDPAQQIEPGDTGAAGRAGGIEPGVEPARREREVSVRAPPPGWTSRLRPDRAERPAGHAARAASGASTGASVCR